MCNKGNQGLKLCTRKYLYNTREQWWTRTTTKKKNKKKTHVRHRENTQQNVKRKPYLIANRIKCSQKAELAGSKTKYDMTVSHKRQQFKFKRCSARVKGLKMVHHAVSKRAGVAMLISDILTQKSILEIDKDIL